MAKNKRNKGPRKGEVQLKRKFNQEEVKSRASNEETVSLHKQRFTYMETERSEVKDMWELVAKNIAPMREDMDQKDQPGERHGLEIYDGTGISAANIATSGMFGNVLNASLPWFMVQSPITELNKVAEVRAWFQDVTERLLSALRLSNFYTEALPFLYDGHTIGTASMYSEYNFKKQKIVFTTIHPGQVYIAEDDDGSVDTVYRKYRPTLRNLVQKFGKEGISPKLHNDIESSPFKKVNILHAIFPREEFDPRRKDNLNKPVGSVWIDLDNNYLMMESGYNSMPTIVWRYAKNSGETYGRSPATEALSDLMGLNQIGKDMLGASNRATNPPVQAPEDMRGNVKLGANKINYYSSPERVIKALDFGKYPITVDQQDRLRDLVKQHYFVDFYISLQNAERQMTAMEVGERQAEKAVGLAPVVGRLTANTLESFIERVFDIEMEQGRIPPPPPMLLEAQAASQGGVVSIQYLGPLTQIQQRRFEGRGLETTVEQMIVVRDVFPEALDVVDPTKLGYAIVHSKNVSQDVIRTPEEVQVLRQQRAEAAAAQAQAEQAKLQAGAAKDMASASSMNEDFAEVTKEIASGGA
ncbi:MAG: head-tail connector protein [Deltaproteobacteria bacterium]|nr:head-tail connector protein [Deltaproteobacteria bacterium]